jgi:segregation and condensation protein A
MTETIAPQDTAQPPHSIIVHGQTVTDLPHDLYIPPDALEVFLEETFTGPMDLLLYLIKKQNLDILDISIADVSKQYQAYIELMQEMKLELAAEYLLMAALLAEIKSRLLLPRHPELEEGEEDPRAELIRRLKEYEQIKQAAEKLDELPRVDRDILLVSVLTQEIEPVRTAPPLHLEELIAALRDALKRADLRTPHLIPREALSVRERMSQILTSLQTSGFQTFSQLFDPAEGRLGIVVTFIAILELLKQSTIDMVQEQPYAPIHIRAKAS